MDGFPLFAYLLVYEFRYQGHVLMRECYAREQFMNARELCS